MKTLNCLIVDDESLARKLIAEHVEKAPGMEVFGSCSKASEALELLQKERIDVLFLDIQMPDLSGMEMLTTIPEKDRPATIFTTAYSEYAVEGFDLNAVDYLLKPISFDRFMKAVNKARNWLLPQENEGNLEQTGQYITVKGDGRIHRINTRDILYIEGLKEYVRYQLTDGRVISLISLKKLVDTLPDSFKRVHRSYIVNTDRVRSLYGNQLEIGEHRIPIGKSYKKEVVEMLFPNL